MQYRDDDDVVVLVFPVRHGSRSKSYIIFKRILASPGKPFVTSSDNKRRIYIK